jgi:3-oxoacyl-[acyl-carrier-protein] synthase II
MHRSFTNTQLLSQQNVMPPTLNLTETTAEFTLNYVPNQPQEKELHAVMSNSFGFGGTNASLLFAK